MKVLFIIKSFETPSSRIRISNLIPELRNRGLVCDVQPTPKSIIAKGALCLSASKYDIVVLQKRLPSILELKYLRSRSKKLLFDFDDAIYMRDASPSENPDDYRSSSKMAKFERVIRNCDGIIAANNVLAEEAIKVRNDVKIDVIPSAVDTSKSLVKQDYAIRTVPIVGWVGISRNFVYLEKFAESLRKLAEKKDFILRVISDRSFQLPGVRTEFMQWSEDLQNREIRNFDVGIMPLSPDPYSEGKSAYKMIQYLAAGVPSLCSPVGMNMDVSENETVALTASSDTQFIEKLTLLFADMELRQRLGRNGRRAAESRYDLKIVAEKLSRTLGKYS